jgi:hypothetical protein
MDTDNNIMTTEKQLQQNQDNNSEGTTAEMARLKNNYNFWESLKNLDNFRWAALSVLPLSFALLIYLISMGALAIYGINPAWLVYLMRIPFLTGALLSGATYLGRLVDAFTTRAVAEVSPLSPELDPAVLDTTLKTANKTGLSFYLSTFLNFKIKVANPIRAGEKWCTLLGISAGAAVTIILPIVCDYAVPFAGALKGLAYAVFGLCNVGVFGGLGNRLGSCCIDKSRLPNERAAIVASVVLGTIMGFTLVFCLSSAVFSALTVTAFFTNGLILLPMVAKIILFTVQSGGITAAAADYATRAYNYFFKQNDPVVQKRIHEYRGAAVGISVGLMMTIGIFVALCLTQPIAPYFAILPFLLMTANFSIFGGLCSRLGRCIDGLVGSNMRPDQTVSPQLTDQQKPEVDNTLELGSALEPLLTPDKNPNTLRIVGLLGSASPLVTKPTPHSPPGVTKDPSKSQFQNPWNNGRFFGEFTSPKHTKPIIIERSDIIVPSIRMQQSSSR